MVFKQTAKGKEEKLVTSVGGSLPTVEYPKYLVITCLKRGGKKKKKKLGMLELKDQREWSKLGSLRRGEARPWGGAGSLGHLESYFNAKRSLRQVCSRAADSKGRQQSRMGLDEVEAVEGSEEAILECPCKGSPNQPQLKTAFSHDGQETRLLGL